MIVEAIFIALRGLIPLGIMLYCFWHFHWKENFLIRFKLLPIYEKLEEEYGAIYPTLMDSLNVPFPELTNRDDLSTCFFMMDSSFHIISLINQDVHFEIPFSSIVYQDCAIIGHSYKEYHYRIQFIFKYEGKNEHFSFTTFDYNHKLDKKYGNRLNGEDLFKFVQENFISKKQFLGF